MRTHTIDNTTIEYPDQIGFCFNPVIINILGGNYQSVTATVTDTTTATSDRENRATFGGSCFFDLSFYTQSYFDEYREVDYKSTHAEDSKLGRLFSIELDMYNESGTLENSFQFNVFILWGASKVGEQYNGSRVLTWFKNYPFSVGLYSATSGNVKVTIDGSESSPIALSGQNAWNIILAFSIFFCYFSLIFQYFFSILCHFILCSPRTCRCNNRRSKSCISVSCLSR